MTIGRKSKFIRVGSSPLGIYYFTEVDELEEVIKSLQQMLDNWRDELALKPAAERLEDE